MIRKVPVKAAAAVGADELRHCLAAGAVLEGLG